ncbi:MAG: redox-sensing transcriptional repressor Rex [Defluviitaleaceae bacterium]|nr:redox-sensing transcriptional repressor Rex [Defluviitaleaceae bacterium]
MSDKISIAVIKRLPRYYRYLGDLLDKDIARISSKELSDRMGITASQIRQDLNNFGSFGQQGYGYNVELLYNEIKSILGLDKVYNLALIGAGNFGQTLVNYPNFAKRGFNFVALFDTNPAIIGTKVSGVEVFAATNLESFLAANHVDIVVLTTPASAAPGIAKTLAASNIKGIWNFSNSDIKVPAHITVENVRLTDSLMTLSYRINHDEILQRVGG